MMSAYENLIVQNGYKDTNVFVSCTLGSSVDMKVSMILKYKSVSDVYLSLLTERQHFTDETWGRIEQSRIGESLNFFFHLFDVMAGNNHAYYNKETQTNIRQNKESQAAARAFHNTNEIFVSTYYMSVSFYLILYLFLSPGHCHRKYSNARHEQWQAYSGQCVDQCHSCTNGWSSINSCCW